MSDNRAKVAGVDELLWPLTQASSDPTNLTKLDANGNVLTSTTDVDARYVQKAGDTMTGPLLVTPSSAVANPNGHIQVVGGAFQPIISSVGYGTGAVQPVMRLARA